MSHTTTLKGVQIRDVAAIRSAVADLVAAGIRAELVDNQKPRMYYDNQHGVCAHVLKLPNCRYDIGFDQQADGTFAPVYDEWAGQISGQIGAACPVPTSPEGKAQHAIGKFLQGYAKHAAINAATAQGYFVESATLDTQGNVQLVLAGM